MELQIKTNPFESLIGEWTGSVNYSVPDVYGGCVQGICYGLKMTIYSSGRIDQTWPVDCAAGSGTTSSVLNPDLYDGTFYKDTRNGQCTRFVQTENKLTILVPIDTKRCVNHDTAPSCSNDAVQYRQIFTKGSAHQTMTALVLLLSIICFL